MSFFVILILIGFNPANLHTERLVYTTTVNPDSTAIIRSKLQEVIMHRRNRQFTEALELLPVIIDYGTRHSDYESLEWAYLMSGHSYLGLNNYERAEYYYRKTLTILDEDNIESRAVVMNNLGNLYHVTDDFENAVKYLEKSISLNEQIDDNAMVLAINYHTLSTIYMINEYYNQAIFYNNKARATLEPGTVNRLYLSIINASGRLAEQIGFYEDALTYFYKVLESASESDNPTFLANAFFNIGSIYKNMGKFEKAGYYFDKYLPFQEQFEWTFNWNRYLLIADYYSVIGNHERALELLDLGEKSIGDNNTDLSSKMFIRYTGLIHSRAGNYEKANDVFKELYKFHTQDESDTYFALAYWYKASNLFNIDRDRAFEVAQTAMRATESYRELIGVGGSITAGFYNRYQPFFAMLAWEYIKDAKIEKAADALERSRSRAFRDEILFHQTNLDSKLNEHQSQQLEQLNVELQLAEQQILRAQESERRSLEISRNRIEREIQLLINELLSTQAEQLPSISYSAVGIAEAQQDLNNYQGILQYSVSGENKFAILTTANTHYVHEINLSTDELNQLLKEIRDGISEIKEIDSLNRLLAKAGHQLIGNLPIGNLTELTILADGILHYLPFEALRFNNCYLAEVMSITYSPSLSIRYYLNLREPQKSNSLLALVNPEFRVSESHQEMLFSDLRSLPYTELEGRLISSVSPFDVNLYSGRYATEYLIKNRELTNYRILHFATHGVVNDHNSRFSGLVLTTPHRPTIEDDGFLRVGEIYDLNLNADLVVLSACDTGLGRFINGEGILGFQRAFMVAGARSVAVSLWSVNDQSTARLMQAFYRNIYNSFNKKQEIDFAHALHEARLHLLNNVSTSHPYFWAPFILFGG